MHAGLNAPCHHGLFTALDYCEVQIALCVTTRSATGLPRTAVVGVLGGGQLGRMMALAAVGAAAFLWVGQDWRRLRLGLKF